MVISKCEICDNENLIKSGIIPGLYYCVQCDNFLFYGENELYPIQDVLRAIGEVFPDLILNIKSLGIIADLCIIKDNFLEIYSNILLSEILEISTLKQDIQVESIESIIMTYSRIIEQNLKIDYAYSEYVIKIIIYALGVDIIVEVPSQEETSIDPSIIKYFKQSTSRILRGGSVEFSWDVRLKHAAITLQIGDKVVSIKNPRYSKRITFTENTVVTLIVKNKKNHQDLARKQLQVQIVDPVEILEFEPSRYISLESLPIHLKWTVKNAEKIVLLPINQDLTTRSIYTVHPVVSTTYILKASNECSSVERSCSISIKKLPSISHINLPSYQSSQSYGINVRLPNIQIKCFSLNFSIGSIKAIPIISYILPFPEKNCKTIIINIYNNWYNKLKSLFYYFDKSKKES